MENRDFYTYLVILVGVLGLTFLAGIDAGYKEKEKPTNEDRIRIYCTSPGHSENLCKHVNEEVK